MEKITDFTIGTILTTLEGMFLGSFVEEFITKPIPILAGGVAVLASAVFMIWGAYKGYMILCGFESEPFMPFFRNLLLTTAILMLSAFSGGKLAEEYVIDPLKNLPENFAKQLAPNATTDGTNGIFSTLNALITEVFKAMNAEEIKDVCAKLSEDERKKDPQCVEIDNQTNPDGSAVTHEEEEKGFWASIKGAFKKLFGWFAKMCLWLKLAILALFYIAYSLIVFWVVFKQKVMFYITLGLAPLFIFFAAWKSTKGWFSTWLNIAVGYAFSYPIILLVTYSVLDMVKDAIQPSQYFEGGTLSWGDVGALCIALTLLSFMMSQIAGLSSNLFQGISAGIGDAVSASKKGFGNFDKKDKGSGGSGSGGSGSSFQAGALPQAMNMGAKAGLAAGLFAGRFAGGIAAQTAKTIGNSKLGKAVGSAVDSATSAISNSKVGRAVGASAGAVGGLAKSVGNKVGEIGGNVGGAISTGAKKVDGWIGASQSASNALAKTKRDLGINSATIEKGK